MVEDRLLSLQFEGINQPILFHDCAELYPLLRSIFRDSSIVQVPSVPEETVQITLRRTEAGYERASLWLAEPVIHSDPVDTVCDLTVDLFHAFAADNPGYLCLHSAAALFKQGLFLFPSTYRSGKSTLSLHLVFNGVPIFTDDALPLTPESDEAMATGHYPRLRLPLPESVTNGFRSYIRQRVALRNDRYCYVALDQNEQLPLGKTAPIEGIVLLDLNSDCENAVLEQTGRKDVIKEIILRNFARQNKALDIVERIYAIVDKADCYKLTYADPDLAAKLLITHFH